MNPLQRRHQMVERLLREALAPTDEAEVKVEEAMSQETFSVRPESSVEEVALEMAEHKYGCAVVIDGEKVVGVFTTTDALRALAELAHAPGGGTT